MSKHNHTIFISESKCEITGVEGVSAYDDKEVVLSVIESTLYVSGVGLELENLSIEDKTAIIKGKVTALRYKKSAPKLAFLKRLTK